MVNGDTTGRWPVKHEYPLPGAVLPFKRVVSYYGNLYSKQMGILGELPKREMLKKLQYETDRWAKADPTTPAVPALHYIAVTAQLLPGKGGKYRLRMPFHQIDTVINWARRSTPSCSSTSRWAWAASRKRCPSLRSSWLCPTCTSASTPNFR
jgi:hypothetical protein